MNAPYLIVYAHPNREGFCGEFLRCVEVHLQRNSDIYDVIDLYAIIYDPVLKNGEHYTSGGHEIAVQTHDFQQKILQAQHLIFIYPVWWQNMPAILKGFVDRTFTPRFAFEYRHNLPFGLLKGRKAAVFSSSGGPRFYTRLWTHDRAVRVLVDDVLRFCGIKARSFSVGSARTLTDAKKKDIARLVQKGMRFLAS